MMVSAVVEPETKEAAVSCSPNESWNRNAIYTRMALTLEYNGTRYSGSQLQRKTPTVQSELEGALFKLTGEKLRVTMASRTDAGVHSRGQVASFKTSSTLPPQTFVRALNYYLPRDIAVKAAYRVEDSFHARRGAVSREYSYHILNSPTRSPLMENFAYLVTEPLDIEAMERAGKLLIGEHDFASFATKIEARAKSTVRKVYRAEVRREEELVVFNMEANSFLPHQVRNTVGALVRVGTGRMSVDEFKQILEARKPALGGPTAPAWGLYLTRVNYPRPLQGES